MNQDPGNPNQTDPEATSAEAAEAAIDEAQEAQEEQAAADAADPASAADVDELLAQVEAEVQENLDEAPEAEDAVADSVEDLLAERTEDLQRLTAEYTNYRRRAQREREASSQAAKAQVITQLLPILDDLDLAEQHGDLTAGPLKAFRDKFVKTVEDLGVVGFGAVGEPFDPERHEAVQDLSQGDEKLIGTVLRRGYEVNDRLLRTAMVIIADPEA